MKRRLISLACTAALLLTLAGCDMDAIYDDAAKLASRSSSYSMVNSSQTVRNQAYSGRVGKFSGMYQVWTYDAPEACQATLTCSLEVTKGKVKLVLIAPDGAVETLVEETGRGEEQTLTLNLDAGESRMKLVGAEEAAFSWSMEIDRGGWYRAGDD